MDELQSSFIFNGDELAYLLDGLVQRKELRSLLQLDASFPEYGAQSLEQKGLLNGNTVDPVVAYIFRAISTAEIEQGEECIRLRCRKMNVLLKPYPKAKGAWRLTPMRKEEKNDVQDTY